MGNVICGFTSLGIQIGVTWPTVAIHGDVQDIDHTSEDASIAEDEQ